MPGTSDTPEPPGQPGKLVTRRDVEPAGANCARGGAAIRIGLDGNGNGALDDDEIIDSEYLCDGSTATLVRTEPSVRSAQCPDGGIAVSMGLDDDGDGVLDDAEIDQTTIACSASELWIGDLTAGYWQYPDSSELLNIRVITGKLQLPPGAPAALPNLQIVSGDVEITADHEVSLPRLYKVGGALRVHGQIAALRIPELHSIAGDLDVQTQGALALVAPSLQEIGGSLYAEASSLTSIEMPWMSRLGGSLQLGSQCSGLSVCGGGCGLPQLTRITMPRLSTVHGCVAVSNTPLLEALDLPVFWIDDTLWIFGAPALKKLLLPKMTSVGRTALEPRFDIMNTGLETIELPKLTALRGTVFIENNPSLREVHLPLLEGNDEMWIGLWGNPALSIISAPSLDRVRRLDVSNAGTLDLAALRVVWELKINAPLTDLSGFHALEFVADLDIRGTERLTDLRGLDSLTTVQSLHVAGNHALTSLDGLERITDIPFIVDIMSNPVLSSVTGLRNVTRIGSLLVISGNSLTELKLPSLRAIDQNLWLSTRLTSLAGLGALTWLGKSFAVDTRSNPALPPDEIIELRTRLGK